MHRYVFQKTAIGNEKRKDDGTCEDRSSIHLEMYSGKLVPNLHRAENMSFDVKKEDLRISEEEALKEGKCFQVGQSSRTVKQSKVEENVHVYLRERFWMEARGIIGKDGNPRNPERGEKAAADSLGRSPPDEPNRSKSR